MKNIYSILLCLFATSLTYAQDAMNKQVQQNKNAWKDPAYFQEHRSALDAILKMQAERWNQSAGYLVRGEGDTVRPYTRSNWLRDSLMLENRNWADPNASWPASVAKGNVYQPGKNYKLDSASMNRAGRTQDSKFGALPGTTHSLEKDNFNNHTGQDFMYMKNQQLMVSRSGITSKVLGSITLHDGSKVLADGSIQLTNGNTMQLKKGERINLFEKKLEIIPAPAK